MAIKNAIREILMGLKLDVTKNIEYDRLTAEIIKKNVLPTHNCIDVGCHKGEILSMILQASPNGKHFGFEPIPVLFESLKKNYGEVASIYPYALSIVKGTTSFNFIKNAPAYSGIKKRDYKVKNPDIEKIQVETQLLDDVIPQDLPIHFIKIDVEGGEFDVLKGGEQLLKMHQPMLLFECGKGASEYYGTQPAHLYEYIVENIGLSIFSLKNFIAQKPAYEKEVFVRTFEQNTEYYFVAVKKV